MSSEQLPFPALPYDNNLQIASYLSLDDLMSTRRVSKVWNNYSFWCIAAVDTADFEQLKLKCKILLKIYSNNPTPVAQKSIAQFFSQIVKARIAELEVLQKKVKEDFDRHALVGAVLNLPDALEDASRKYPRLLPIVRELSDLTHLLQSFNENLGNSHKIRPILSEFILWCDYAENDGKDCPIIYFDYWQLYTGVICYDSSISINNTCLYNISIADDRNSNYFGEHLENLTKAALAYNIRFICYETFGDFDKYFEPTEDAALVEMNRRSQLRFCETLQQEKSELRKEMDRLIQELIQGYNKETYSDLINSDAKDREIADLRMQLRKREIEVEIQKMLLQHTPPSLSVCIHNGYDHDNTKMVYYDKLQPGYLKKRAEINALIMENTQLRERVKLIQQELAKINSVRHKYKPEDKVSEGHTFTEKVELPDSRRQYR